jgi:hypothetical protein
MDGSKKTGRGVWRCAKAEKRAVIKIGSTLQDRSKEKWDTGKSGRRALQCKVP